MSHKKKLLIKVGDRVEIIGEVDNTTSTIMEIHDRSIQKGLRFTEFSKGGEKEGLSLLATTLCG